jgi:hypothetical protein
MVFFFYYDYYYRVKCEADMGFVALLRKSSSNISKAKKKKKNSRRKRSLLSGRSLNRLWRTEESTPLFVALQFRRAYEDGR